MVNVDVRRALAKHIISRETHPHIPSELDGEILLEEHVVEGVVLGYITVSIENLVKILDMRDNASLRANVDVDFKGVKRNLRDLSASEFEEFTGYKKYLDKWRAEGIRI